VAFYERAFGAREIYRITYPDGRIVDEMAVGATRFRVTDEAWPRQPITAPGAQRDHLMITLLVADPDAVVFEGFFTSSPAHVLLPAGTGRA
jgi:uncharacterized glyoxalase superfamily protein PhnB